MSFLAELAGSQMSNLGISPETLSGLTSSLQLNDILGIAIRTACVGLLAFVLRAILVRAYAYVYEAIFPSAHLSNTDPAFNWVMVYLAQDEGAQKQLKSFRLNTADTRESKRDMVRGRTQVPISASAASFQMKDIVGTIAPLDERSISIRHQGSWLWVKRSSKGFALTDTNKEIDHLQITSLWFQSNAIKQFLLASHERFFKKSDSEILIFHPLPSSNHLRNLHWCPPLSRPSRAWESVILPNRLKDELLEDVRDFITEEQKAWYQSRGIPHRRGYLLHGRPGAGKTTLATAVASALKLDVYVINPSTQGMDDDKLNKAFRVCPSGSMILIEDIDCVMPPRIKAEKEDEAPEDDEDASMGAKGAGPKSAVTLSGLLNAIDGVSSQEDCVLFASTNHPERLDPALSRPGRFDIHVAFEDATPAQARALFKHIYSTADPADNADEQVKEKPVIDEKQEQEAAIVQDLAQKFSESVFGIDKLTDGTATAVSMAALQGYLLKHKKSPVRAADEAREWAEGLRQIQEDKVVKRLERLVSFRLAKEKAEQERLEREKKLEEEKAKLGAGEAEKQKADDGSPPTPVSPAAPTQLNL